MTLKDLKFITKYLSRAGQVSGKVRTKHWLQFIVYA